MQEGPCSGHNQHNFLLKLVGDPFIEQGTGLSAGDGNDCGLQPFGEVFLEAGVHFIREVDELHAGVYRGAPEAHGCWSDGLPRASVCGDIR